ncbi:regulation of nuclear pre-mRNA domain-containing protein, partial [Trifolium medium]|nr:regulation of nuclear pre-mRNA domain-containing protein [Trifolium medium]
QHVRKIEKDVDIACTIAKDPKRITLKKDLEQQQNLLKDCIEKLKLFEASRVALISQLKEALHEQESDLENVRTQMQVRCTIHELFFSAEGCHTLTNFLSLRECYMH